MSNTERDASWDVEGASAVPEALRYKLIHTLTPMVELYPERARDIGKMLVAVGELFQKDDGSGKPPVNGFEERIGEVLADVSRIVVPVEFEEGSPQAGLVMMAIVMGGVAEALRTEFDTSHRFHGRVDRKLLADEMWKIAVACWGKKLLATEEGTRWITRTGLLKRRAPAKKAKTSRKAPAKTARKARRP
jgi:hypothetical protein